MPFNNYLTFIEQESKHEWALSFFRWWKLTGQHCSYFLKVGSSHCFRYLLSFPLLVLLPILKYRIDIIYSRYHGLSVYVFPGHWLHHGRQPSSWGIRLRLHVYSKPAGLFFDLLIGEFVMHGPIVRTFSFVGYTILDRLVHGNTCENLKIISIGLSL